MSSTFYNKFEQRKWNEINKLNGISKDSLPRSISDFQQVTRDSDNPAKLYNRQWFRGAVNAQRRRYCARLFASVFSVHVIGVQWQRGVVKSKILALFERTV